MTLLTKQEIEALLGKISSRDAVGAGMTISAEQAALDRVPEFAGILRKQASLFRDLHLSSNLHNAAGWMDYLASALIASEAARKLAEERLAVAQTIARQGKDTIAAVLLLEIAAALKEHERVVLTRDETSLGLRVMEFAAIFKEIDNG